MHAHLIGCGVTGETALTLRISLLLGLLTGRIFGFCVEDLLGFFSFIRQQCRSLSDQDQCDEEAKKRRVYEGHVDA